MGLQAFQEERTQGWSLPSAQAWAAEGVPGPGVPALSCEGVLPKALRPPQFLPLTLPTNPEPSAEIHAATKQQLPVSSHPTLGPK